jgi:CubicO group peptidase (beta-lactamase class C family)
MLSRRLCLCLLVLVSTGSRTGAGTAPDGWIVPVGQTGATLHGSPVVTGDLQQWHRVSLTFDGPQATEDGRPNPFRDVRLEVEFTHVDSGEVVRVPGFFAADGAAAESSATGGTKWRAHFAPPRAGVWRWRVSCRTGTDIAIAEDASAGQPWRPLDGASGTIEVAASTARVPDFRARGALRYVGQRYLRFAGDGTAFLKAGVGSPETLLGYADFDGTFRDLSTTHLPPPSAGLIELPALEAGLHRYAPHLADWRPADPAWKDGRGKGLIGGLTYLAAQGVNSIYFLTMNVNGDGRNVWPWTDPRVRDRFDVSKLDQWEIVFSHMTRLGIALHVVTQETENDRLLDGGALGPERKLYYRELVARFAHHPALTWNLGEENVQSVAQQKASSAWLSALDPYRHPIVIHNDHWHAKNLRETFDPLLGFAPITGTAIQDFHWNDVHAHVRHYVRASAAAGHPWVVAADELGGAALGTMPDADDPAHDRPRVYGLWGTLMAGGAGVEWYFGWQNNSPHSDLSAEDWRTREEMYRQTRIAVEFFHRHVPFDRMQPMDEIAVGHGVSCLALPGEVYLFHLPKGGATRFDLGPRPGLYEVRWFDPRRGGDLAEGSVRRVRGPGLAWTGTPPGEPDRDWVAVVKRVAETAPPTQFPQGAFTEASPEDLGVHPVGLDHALNGWRVALGRDGIDKTVVLRRGVVIHRGPKADARQPVWSVTKSFTGTALGLLVADGRVSLDTLAASVDPGLRARYPEVTLRHFATMTSGYSAPGRSRWGEPSEDWSRTPFVPGPPLFAPGTRFAYWDEAQMMLGRLLTRVAGRDLLTLLADRVFAPLGVAGVTWDAEGTVDGLTIRNGCTGLRLGALDLARLGHLFLSRGRWDERQLIPEDWVREATRAQVPAHVPVADTDRRRLDGAGIYGFNWWTNGQRADGARPMPHAPAGTFLALGLHHNVLIVVPEWEMVIVRLGEDEERGDRWAILDDLLRRLGMAVSPLE